MDRSHPGSIILAPLTRKHRFEDHISPELAHFQSRFYRSSSPEQHRAARSLDVGTGVGPSNHGASGSMDDYEATQHERFESLSAPPELPPLQPLRVDGVTQNLLQRLPRLSEPSSRAGDLLSSHLPHPPRHGQSPFPPLALPTSPMTIDGHRTEESSSLLSPGKRKLTEVSEDPVASASIDFNTWLQQQFSSLPPITPFQDPGQDEGQRNVNAFVYNSYEGLTEEERNQEDADAAEQAEGGIIADHESVTDAGYESDTVSAASTSVTSSVRDFAFENGRRYHRYREGRYNFPNDDVEQEREDMKHVMVTMLCQQLHFAPIGNNPNEILDIGTGTGKWAIEMGETYASASVLGIDLSPIQPDWVPPNVRFMVDDIESPWVEPRNHYDYIHSRHTVMAIKNWPRLMRNAYEHLKPGGWIELQEIHHIPMSGNDTPLGGHPVYQYWQYVSQGLGALGVDLELSGNGRIAELMRQSGYVNVTERVFHVPIGTWPKNRKLKSVGLYWKTILLDGCQAIALGPMTRGLRWSREEVELFLVDVRKAYHDNSSLMYMPLVCVYGQKPMYGQEAMI